MITSDNLSSFVGFHRLFGDGCPLELGNHSAKGVGQRTPPKRSPNSILSCSPVNRDMQPKRELESLLAVMSKATEAFSVGLCTHGESILTNYFASGRIKKAQFTQSWAENIRLRTKNKHYNIQN